MMTDVLALKENSLSVSCVNLSCGYYNPHSDEEITVKKDLQKCLSFVEHVIEGCTDVYPHTRATNTYPATRTRMRFTTYLPATLP